MVPKVKDGLENTEKIGQCDNNTVSYLLQLHSIIVTDLVHLEFLFQMVWYVCKHSCGK